MKYFFRTSILFGMFFSVAFSIAFSQKKPLDHSVYDSWRTVQERALSNDGKWVQYSLIPQQGDATQEIKPVGSGKNVLLPRGRNGQFSYDSQFAVSLIKPPFLVSRQATRDKKKPEDMPKDTLAIVRLSDGSLVKIGRVKSFAMPEKAGGWLAYLMEKPIAKPDSSKKATPPPKDAPKDTSKDDKKKTDKKKDEGTPLVLRNLGTSQESVFENVISYKFAEKAQRLVFTTSAADSLKDGVFSISLSNPSRIDTLMAGRGNYKQLILDENGNQVAFVSDHNDYRTKKSAYALYYWNGNGKAKLVADSTTAAFPKHWSPSEHATLNFSKDGSKLFFGTALKPQPDPKETPDDEKVSVDVWNWQDDKIQPMQLVQAEQEKKRTFRAVFHVASGKVVQLADENMPNLTLGDEGNANIAIGSSDVKYRAMNWETPSFNDYYIVNITTGERKLLLQKVQVSVQISPKSNYVYWWDGAEKAWFVQGITETSPRNITQNVSASFVDDEHDQPMLPSPIAFGAQWTDGDKTILLRDKFDIWELDPNGKNAARNITEGKGRKENIRFALLNLDPEARTLNPNQQYLLSAFHTENKSAGFYTDKINGIQEPKQILFTGHRYSFPIKAKNADVVMWTRETFQEFPNLWTSNLEFKNTKQHSDANPQQREYLWGTSELVSWRSSDGVPLQGILYKPENFDPKKKYPMLVYFYERLSDGLHGFSNPAPGSSSINTSFYVSRGYLVFQPDIPYQIGYPGESAMDAIVPGVLSLMEKGFVDEQNIGAQGHSWGGYQAAYMITQTNLFKAVEAGAIVANMTSAYGGIRWGTGMSRQFQYERTQSRIGGTLWQNPLQYIENSPLFWADKVNTPILMMHNDHDDAVPWYQGIEFYMALRRLNKPVWMLNYNGEFHGLRKRQNQEDFAIRMQQFFDHYLKGAPMPTWMKTGVPAVQKGTTLGLGNDE